MFVLEINTSNFGSTGNIALHICEACKKNNINTVVAYAKSRSNMKKKVDKGMFVGNRISRNVHLLLSYITGFNGCFSLISTIAFFNKLEIKPDIIHLHNLHNCYINMPYLFHYIKKHNIKVVWTLHDCWSFTGRCPHFVMAKCDKWKTGCNSCPYPKTSYPQSFIDTSSIMWKLKRRWFTGIEDCTLVTPSEWLADLVKQSFLKDYPVKVINNGIDLSIFKPSKSDFRERYGLSEKKIVLGVSFGWGKGKGIDVFIDLAGRLQESYQIILVGTDDEVDKFLPSNIISIHRTQDQKELAEIYTSADVLANPTREEVLGLVNVESLACGTPVVTFKSGGSPECIDETCGAVVDCDDVDAMESEIRRICEQRPYSIEACIQRAKRFNMNARFEEYVELYKSIREKG